MRNLARTGIGAVLALGFVLCGLAQERKEKPILGWEYKGQKELLTIEQAKTLQEVLRLPETEALWNAGFERVGNLAALRYSKGQTNPVLAKTISSLVRDLGIYESRFELAAAGSADWILAVRLPDERHAEWSTNLSRMATAAGLGAPRNRNQGWEVSGGEKKYNLQLFREGGWTVLNGGYAAADSHKAFIAGLGKKNAERVLKFDADLSALGTSLGIKDWVGGPRLDLSVAPRGDGLRSDLKVVYPKDLGIKHEKWKLPLETIREPLIGFTAIQGLQSRFQTNQYIQKAGLEKSPNQLFLWAQSISPFALFAAADVGNPKKAIDAVVKNLIPELNTKLQNRAIGNIEMNTNSYLLAWRGLPVIVPFLRPGEGKDASLLVGGFFPVSNPSTNHPPGELLAEVNKKNLVYYDWEITEARLAQWRPLWQVHRIVNNLMIPGENSPSEKWLAAIAPKLGNTVTEGTLENSREIGIVRRSHLGLSSLELVLLAHWLDGSDEKVGLTEGLRRNAKKGGSAGGLPLPVTPAPQPPGSAPKP